MTKMIQKKCKTCKSEFSVRLADHNRGWGKFCSKSCKAKEQEKRTGQYSSYKSNFMGTGVSKDTYVYYAEQFGGIPQFDRRGNYIGFTDGYFDNTYKHQDSD